MAAVPTFPKPTSTTSLAPISPVQLPTMVCAKCQKLTKPTSLATPGVKKKSEMYYGSPAGTKTASAGSSATLGQTSIGKSKLLSASAKNPYAAYAAKCTGKECVTKIESGRKYCNKCAYRANACAVCGKKNAPEKKAAPVIAGQKFTLK
ncbi:hypothetical protein VC83_05846 [Pseudogymnoascus destructans]|nr:uncharacterized protein VC83_05846 [Pseudogymnoascus destructans]OAF57206.2 hypothetical protein VC83_05846 [Pseudogymnoascus destructans]